ncbi:MAG: hypothetical protein ABIN97_10400 [Ginsengibacter sp.]
MKKTFLFRLFAITLFCFTSLAIKSESSSCGSTCDNVPKTVASSAVPVLSQDKTDKDFKYNAFFIKI